ncbi:MAG: hypothetical protein M1831_002827 [Alyxoria varia]|nr:MAG: hypothetical protein M1831_002827 [Alyxoria varia]
MNVLATASAIRQDRRHPSNLMSYKGAARGQRGKLHTYRPSSLSSSSSVEDLNHEFQAKNLGPLPAESPPRSRGTSPGTTASSTAPSTTSRFSAWRNSTSSCTTDFDELYDVSDADSEVVPLKLSNSVKQAMQKVPPSKRESLPSLVIPSPAAWPTIEKLKKDASPTAPPPPSKIPLSPAVLAKLSTAHLKVPGTNSTPSLDGSIPTDESASMSPSTPDSRSDESETDDWDGPHQLDADAMDLLDHIAQEEPALQHAPIHEVPDPQHEMQDRGLNIDVVFSPNSKRHSSNSVEQEPLSAISVPSPGGFLSSLDPSSQRMWNLPKDVDVPSTATAEHFYELPWNMTCIANGRIVPGEDAGSDGPPTARQAEFETTPTEDSNQLIIRNPVFEYDEGYDRKLYETANSNMSRTGLWLAAQETYMDALKGTNPVNANASPHTSPNLASPADSGGVGSPSRKEVRFVEPAQRTPVTAKFTRPATALDSLFYHAFQHLQTNARSSDAFTMRYIRADALQAQRSHLPKQHRAQLFGRYLVPAPKRPDKEFSHLPSAPNDPSVQKRREAVALADRERQALQQVSLAHWTLQAQRLLGGGHLLPKPARTAMSAADDQHRTPRILDLGGVPTADWAWAISLEYRNAKIYTAIVPPSQNLGSGHEGEWPNHRGPSNHRTLTLDKPWHLPFPSDSFDVVSARTLHALLHTRKAACTNSDDPAFSSDFELMDEYVATLAEIRRILVPGGVLHYNLLDAEISSLPTSTSSNDSLFSQPRASPTVATYPAGVNGGTASALAARSVEFAVSLKSRGYDPSSGRRMNARLVQAGFVDDSGDTTNRSEWLTLPVSNGKGRDTGESSSDRGSSIMNDTGGMVDLGAVTEVVGAVAWERWMLSFQSENRKEEGKMLDGLALAMDGARKGAAVAAEGSDNASELEIDVHPAYRRNSGFSSRRQSRPGDLVRVGAGRDKRRTGSGGSLGSDGRIRGSLERRRGSGSTCGSNGGSGAPASWKMLVGCVRK